MQTNFNRDEVLRDVGNIVMDTFDEVNDDAVVYAKSVTPVRTRRVQCNRKRRKAQRVSRTRITSRFENHTSYARFVDKGTVKMAARNMSGQTIDAVYPQAAAKLKARLG